MEDKILSREAYDCYRFLIDHTNFTNSSTGYGLTLDRINNPERASIAGTGFMLSALVIGAINGWDKPECNRRRAFYTIKNFYDNIPHYNGIFAHYLEYANGKRYKKCEFSTIDTALLISGMLTADSYFDMPELSAFVDKIYQRIDWNKFVFTYRHRFVFRMAYNDITGGDYLQEANQGWIYRWSMMAEQLIMYILAAASPAVSSQLAKKLFLGFERNNGGYRDNRFVYTPLGSLFVYQYSHAWFDFRKYYDMSGYCWFNNSIQAVKANYHYCCDRKNDYKTFAAGLWGLSSCDSPNGYRGYGAPPFITYDNIDKFKERTDGTVAVYAILGSLPFAPEIVKATVCNLADNYSQIIGPYGFYDSINLDAAWISNDCLAIDKGITLLMIDNYYNETNWRYFMKHRLIKEGVRKLAFIRKEESDVDN